MNKVVMEAIQKAKLSSMDRNITSSLKECSEADLVELLGLISALPEEEVSTPYMQEMCAKIEQHLDQLPA